MSDTLSPRAAIRRTAAELADADGRVILGDIAARLGCSYWTVYYHARQLREAGCFPYLVRHGRHALGSGDRNCVLRLLATDSSPSRVAAAFKAETGRRISRTTVRRIRDED